MSSDMYHLYIHIRWKTRKTSIRSTLEMTSALDTFNAHSVIRVTIQELYFILAWGVF